MRQKIEDVFSAGIGEVNILPVVNIDSVQKLNDSELPETLPILALRNAVLFPSTVTPISIGRDKSIKLVRDVYGSGKILGAISQRDVNVEDPHQDNRNARRNSHGYPSGPEKAESHRADGFRAVYVRQGPVSGRDTAQEE